MSLVSKGSILFFLYLLFTHVQCFYYCCRSLHVIIIVLHNFHVFMVDLGGLMYTASGGLEAASVG